MNENLNKFQNAVKGMKMESWEVREHSNGKRKLYVRYIPDAPSIKTKAYVKKA
jgi:hypothetical protein